MSTAPTETRTGQHSLFGWSLAALLREWSARVDAAADDLPQGTRGYQLLTAVVHGDLPSQAALAASLGIDRTVMTYLLDAFEGCGLVERQQDPADRRARRIVATDHGLEVLAAMDARVAAAEEELLSGLEPAQRAVLRELLEQAATGTGPDHDPCRTVVQATRPGAAAPDAR
ncbi:MarR family winged helix-turn-helix transcriptional regulator [Promicromonospora sp. MEB111]|uniref:MarR family winged helix-turn-helix transcriptional regulator n=1 Tax=Promicromonospora sp. MEB111 TaxID=3040301 RepID=UPI00254DFE7C|nr:MarR family winged helix-turn-helix transcriptional regulator [Promicromonospora sp. MEB111]